MDKKVLGLLGGAISAIALLGPARAETMVAPAPTQSLAATSFDELLQPLANPVRVLQSVDEADANAQGQPVGGDLTLVEHHHHHHHVIIRRYHHHHHHHVIIRRYHHHHHHHFLRHFLPH